MDRGPNFETAIQIQPKFHDASSAVQVDISLRPGFHVYTVGEETGRPIRIALDDGAWAAKGDAVYPTGTRKQTALGTSVVVEGQASARLPVESKGDAPGAVKGQFHYQVCTNEACDRPRKIPFKVQPAPAS